MKEYEVPKAGNINFWVDKDNKLMAVDSDGNDLLADIDTDQGLRSMTDEEWNQSIDEYYECTPVENAITGTGIMECSTMKRNQTLIDISGCPYDAKYNPTLIERLKHKLFNQGERR
jgi:hypothetical protein